MAFLIFFLFPLFIFVSSTAFIELLYLCFILNSFKDPLKEYVLLIHSVKLALQQRYDKKEEYMNALIDVEAKTASLAKPSSKMLAQLTKEDKTATKQVCIMLTF